MVASSHEVARCGRADVDAAVAAARAAFDAGTWRRTDPSTRKRVLHRFAQLIREDIDHLAMLETLDVGKPILNSVNVDVTFAADCIAYYAEFADKLYDEVAPTAPHEFALVRREPLGVVAAVVPLELPAHHQRLEARTGACWPATRWFSSRPSSRR